MKLEQYAAQHAQVKPQEQQTQEVLTVEQIAAKLDAERLSSLLEQAQDIIDANTDPADMLLGIVGAIFGSESKQAAAAAATIAKDQRPGGPEIAIAAIRQRRKMLNQQRRQIEAQLKAISEEHERLDAEERALISEETDAAAMDSALIDVLTFCKSLDQKAPDLLQQIEKLYNQHHGNLAAMGLLRGCMAELARRQYSAGRLDLIQQQAFQNLQKRVAAEILP